MKKRGSVINLKICDDIFFEVSDVVLVCRKDYPNLNEVEPEDFYQARITRINFVCHDGNKIFPTKYTVKNLDSIGTMYEVSPSQIFKDRFDVRKKAQKQAMDKEKYLFVELGKQFKEKKL